MGDASRGCRFTSLLARSIWREENARSFEKCERTMLNLKLHFLRTLFEWLTASICFSFTNLLEFIDHCNFMA
jgi:hypothetical protein